MMKNVISISVAAISALSLAACAKPHKTEGNWNFHGVECKDGTVLVDQINDNMPKDEAKVSKTLEIKDDEMKLSEGNTYDHAEFLKTSTVDVEDTLNTDIFKITKLEDKSMSFKFVKNISKAGELVQEHDETNEPTVVTKKTQYAVEGDTLKFSKLLRNNNQNNGLGRTVTHTIGQSRARNGAAAAVQSCATHKGDAFYLYKRAK